MAPAAHHPRTDRAAFFAVLALSALTMIFLFWRYPLKTAIVTVVLLCAFWVAARLARWIETDTTDLDHPGEQRTS
jgi:membrane protein implicated in regulation of membrane protease activity